MLARLLGLTFAAAIITTTAFADQQGTSSDVTGAAPEAQVMPSDSAQTGMPNAQATQDGKNAQPSAKQPDQVTMPPPNAADQSNASETDMMNQPQDDGMASQDSAAAPSQPSAQ